MGSLHSPALRALRKPLSSCITFCAGSAPTAIAETVWRVSACGKSGAGTLRAYITAPTKGSGVVDLDSVGCSEITLAADATSIVFTQNYLNVARSSR